MGEVRREGEIGASVDEVWKLISDFGGFIEAMGLQVHVEGHGVGQTRTVTMNGEETVERLEECDDSAKCLKYSIVSGALPVSSYLSTMQLSAIGEGRTKIEWSSTFEPEGISLDDAQRTLAGVYKGGIAGLQARFGA
jgi:hypothetical protein